MGKEPGFEVELFAGEWTVKPWKKDKELGR